MNATIPFVVAALAIVEPLHAEHYGTTRDEVEKRSFAGTREEGRLVLAVDDVEGSIAVRVGNGSGVTVTVKERWSARSEQDLARARRDVHFTAEEGPGRIELAMQTPCSERDRQRTHSRDCDWEHDYEVRFDFEIEVPRETDLELTTVNDGDIHVDGVKGEFRVSNVNGGVQLLGMAGHGRAHTVNGGLTVGFAARPDGELDFATVNGDVDLTFPKGFGAEFEFRTLNGEAYTDFSSTAGVAPIARVEERSTRHGSRHQWSASTAVRLGEGGPRLACETVNGDIRIRESDR